MKENTAVKILLAIAIGLAVWAGTLIHHQAEVDKNGTPYSELVQIERFDDDTFWIERDPYMGSDSFPAFYVYVNGEQEIIVNSHVKYASNENGVQCARVGSMYKGKKENEHLVLTIDPDYGKEHDLLPHYD